MGYEERRARQVEQMAPLNRFLLRHPVSVVAVFCLIGLFFVWPAFDTNGAEPYGWSPIAALAIMGYATAVPVFTPRLFKVRPNEMLVFLLGSSIFPTGMAIWSIAILG